MGSRITLILTLVSLAGCHNRQAAPTPTTFVAERGVLYRVDSTGKTPILALDSATAPPSVPIAPATWTPQPGSTFGVAAKSFLHLAASPSSDWVGWETHGAVHDLIGVTPAKGGTYKVLDFYFDSAADSLKWVGKYLNAYYMPPSGVAEVRVYDPVTGKRLK